ncbi:hypothetical protein LTR37_019820 [Vermiconidia calcicola]|uniref:Uncharacterized protein n=1 Tax=Vermiconidia calcicola TaxID=1690605 RepID=A0ACC3MDC8_9PEZI|nr:hypothetical protein LTR37_019820 [Vermiconidia calcicola]
MGSGTDPNGGTDAPTTGSTTPVLIVGAGPSGATTALLLGRLGIPSIVVSRHSDTANTPRAHIFNQRAMEVLRDAGLESRCRSVASSSEHMMHTSWLHSLAGEEYGRLYAWGNRPARKGDYEMASPCPMSDLPQSELEPILVDEAEKVGAEFRFSTEFISQTTLLDGVETKVRHRPSGNVYHIRSRFLIGADGARSAVLDSIGIGVDGRQLNTAFNVHIKADLSKYLEVRPGSLSWILNPDAPEWSAVGNFRMVRPWTEFVVSMHPAAKDGIQFEPTEKDIIDRLHQMIGNDDIPIKILSSFRWTINDQVAQSWQRDNVICIGDAVHRHPPINGLGSNTCISDAYNIAWKLAYVLKGQASRSILNTITVERKPVGDGIVRRANDGMEDHRTLWNIIGLSAEERRKTTSLMARPEGAALRSAFRQALEKTDDELNALGIQMNQIYWNSSMTLVEVDDCGEPDLKLVNVVKDQVISTYPGYHLPHVWLAQNSQSHRISILDVCGNGKFTLITGIGGSSWRASVKEVEHARPGLVCHVISIGWRQDFMDAYGDWNKVRGVNEDGAVLVRPDHFIAWRCKDLPQEGATKLKKVFNSILPPAEQGDN